MEITIWKLREHPGLKGKAARWFHSKWHVPLEAYQASMDACLAGKGAIPQWYVARDGDAIIGGLGVIENDFHDRKDLRPNVCAVYVEESYRRRGIAGQLLECVSNDLHDMGIDTVYLLTDHTGFYERYGWQFYCMAQGDGEEQPSRLYIHTV